MNSPSSSQELGPSDLRMHSDAEYANQQHFVHKNSSAVLLRHERLLLLLLLALIFPFLPWTCRPSSLIFPPSSPLSSAHPPFPGCTPFILPS